MIATEQFEHLEDLLQQCGEYVTQGCGVSMYPMLKSQHDPVLIHPVVGELKRYDVAIYSVADRYVCHRVLEARGDIYIIRGDNCIRKEEVPREAVFGLVVGFWRFGRFIPVSNKWYRIYSRVWVALNPVLRPFIWARYALRRVASTIKRRVFAR